MPREYIPVALKQQVFDRAQGICEYCHCQARFAMGPLVIEHIFPLSQGGATVAENLALACQGCNNYKYNKTEALDPISSQLTPLFHPRQMAWNEHFAWSEDGIRQRFLHFGVIRSQLYSRKHLEGSDMFITNFSAGRPMK